MRSRSNRNRNEEKTSAALARAFPAARGAPRRPRIPAEELETLLDAYKQTGSVRGAAKLTGHPEHVARRELREHGITLPRGHAEAIRRKNALDRAEARYPGITDAIRDGKESYAAIGVQYGLSRARVGQLAGQLAVSTKARAARRALAIEVAPLLGTHSDRALAAQYKVPRDWIRALRVGPRAENPVARRRATRDAVRCATFLLGWTTTMTAHALETAPRTETRWRDQFARCAFDAAGEAYVPANAADSTQQVARRALLQQTALAVVAQFDHTLHAALVGVLDALAQHLEAGTDNVIMVDAVKAAERRLAALRGAKAEEETAGEAKEGEAAATAGEVP